MIEVKNIVIIGNGFDLAHGLKTSYIHFIESLLDNPELHKDLIGIYPNAGAVNYRHNGLPFLINNSFLLSLLNSYKNSNWGGIEIAYFHLLLDTKDISKLNNEFEIIKGKLEKYLLNIDEGTVIKEFYSFFNSLNNKRTAIINFNYTDTLLRLYGNAVDQCDVINIHGQLEDETNPILFGYASSEEENNTLLLKNNNEYLKNIKSYNYKRTTISEQLDKLLHIDDTIYNVNVYIIGHSCSVSDKNILNRIFNFPKIKDIVIWYHGNYNSYFNSMVNIRRVMGVEKNFKRVVNFLDSIPMP